MVAKEVQASVVVEWLKLKEE
jgi:hypothetical protein